MKITEHVANYYACKVHSVQLFYCNIFYDNQ